jgi:hypothetical protein
VLYQSIKHNHSAAQQLSLRCINQSNKLILLHNSCLCAVSINQTSSSCCTTAVSALYQSIKPHHPAAQQLSLHCINQSNIIILLHNSCLCAVSVKPHDPTAKQLSLVLYQSIKPHHPAAQHLSLRCINQSNIIILLLNSRLWAVSINQTSSSC